LNSKARVTKLDGLRGVFSLMVMFFHYRENMLPEMIYNNFFIRESYLFVDFFFVLSGYVIALNYNIMNASDALVKYLKKRFFRLYPLLLYTTLLFFSYYLVLKLMKIYFPSLSIFNGQDVINLKDECLYLIDTIFLTNSTPFLGSTMGVNIPTWSISSEFISYIFYGIVVFLFVGRVRNLLLLGTIICGLLYSYYQADLFPFNGDFGFVRGLIAFNLGYFVWYFSNKNIKIPNIAEIFIPVLLLILFYYLNFYSVHQPETKQLLGIFVVPLFFSFSILSFLKTDGLISRLLNLKIFQFLGNISYSIYLNHYLIILVIPKLIFWFFGLPQSSLNQVFVFILTTLVVIVYSNFTYKYIEIRFTKYLRRKFL
jgi:peptidoglycan/LPS O-acetylase OafA/YrhL